MIVDELRLVGSPQTNKVMAGELSRIAVRALGRRPPEPRKEGTGQLVYPFDAELAQVAVAYLRTPTRVVRDLYRSSARRLEPLYEELMRDGAVDTRTWGHHARTLSVMARRVDEFAAGERQLIGTVKNAIIDAQGRRGHHLTIDAERPDLPLIVRLDDGDQITVSLDLGAGSLSQRGWRTDQGAAPLREHLAAVLLMLARFDSRHDVLVDPMCGSGTIPIEAVLAARAMPRPLPPVARALSPRPCDVPLFADAAPVVIGSDADLDALLACKSNAAGAGVTGDVVWRRADARTLAPADIAAIAAERGRTAERGVILSNPPYGERLDAGGAARGGAPGGFADGAGARGPRGSDDPALLDLYADLGVACRRFRGWRAAFIVANPEFEYAFGPQPRIKKPLANGNLRAYFFLYEL